MDINEMNKNNQQQQKPTQNQNVNNQQQGNKLQRQETYNVMFQNEMCVKFIDPNNIDQHLEQMSVNDHKNIQDKQVLVQNSQEIYVQLMDMIKFLDLKQNKKNLTSQMQWCLSILIEYLSNASWQNQYDQKDRQNIEDFQKRMLEAIKTIQNDVLNVLQKNNFWDKYGINKEFGKIFAKFDNIIQCNFIPGLEFMKDKNQSKDFDETLIYLAPVELYLNRIDLEFQAVKQIYYKLSGVVGEELKKNLKNEFSIIIWFCGGFDGLTTIDFMDFYDTFKKFMERVYEIQLNDSYHKNKIEYYMDSASQGKLTPQNVSDFFDFCWSNPKDQKLMLENTKLQWDKLGNADDQLIIEVLNINPQNDFMKIGQTFQIDSKGYREGYNYGNGLVRVGRKSVKAVVINDIYVSNKDSLVSRRQFMISYSKVYKFRLCDTSTSNPIELMLQKNQNAKLFKEKIIYVGEYTAFKVVEIVQSALEMESDGEEEGQAQFSTLNMKKQTLRNFTQSKNVQEMTCALTRMQQADKTNIIAFKQGYDLAKQDRTMIFDNEERKRVDEINQVTVNFKDNEQQLEQNSQFAQQVSEFGPYLGAYIILEVLWDKLNPNQKQQKIILKVFERKNSFKIGKNSKCDYVIQNQPDLHDIQAQIQYEKGNWFIISPNEFNPLNLKQKLGLSMKTYSEMVTTKPSKNYKIKDGMIVGIFNNIFKFHNNNQKN